MASGLDPQDVRATWEGYLSFDPEIVAERARDLMSPPEGVALSVQGGVLHAVGVAPIAWIDEAQRLARSVPGVASFAADSLQSSELMELHRLAEDVERQRILFRLGSAALDASQDSTVSAVLEALGRMVILSEATSASVQVELVGRSDSSGTERTNLPLSASRARAVERALVARGAPSGWISVVGVGDGDPLPTGRPDDHATQNRSVSIRVTVRDSIDLP